jgi:hypothetical protein
LMQSLASGPESRVASRVHRLMELADEAPREAPNQAATITLLVSLTAAMIVFGNSPALLYAVHELVEAFVRLLA